MYALSQSHVSDTIKKTGAYKNCSVYPFFFLPPVYFIYGIITSLSLYISLSSATSLSILSSLSSSLLLSLTAIALYLPDTLWNSFLSSIHWYNSLSLSFVKESCVLFWICHWSFALSIKKLWIFFGTKTLRAFLSLLNRTRLENSWYVFLSFFFNVFICFLFLCYHFCFCKENLDLFSLCWWVYSCFMGSSLFSDSFLNFGFWCFWLLQREDWDVVS